MKRSLQQVAVPCPKPPEAGTGSTHPGACATLISGSPARASHSDDVMAQGHTAGDSVSSVGSDEVFSGTNVNINQPKHGILKTKILERRLNSRSNSRQLPAEPSPTRVRFQATGPSGSNFTPQYHEGTNADRYEGTSTDRPAEYAEDVINFDNNEMEITI